MKYDIFFSYSNLDRHIAEELVTKLKANGLKCFMAEKSLPVGMEWVQKVREAIQDSERILILITPRSINSKWVYLEIGAAWIEGKTIIPLTQFIDLSLLPEVMRNLQAKCIETEKQKLELIHELTAKDSKGSPKIKISLDFLIDRIRIAKSQMDQVYFQPNLFVGCGRGGAICASIFASSSGFHPLKVIDCQYIGSGKNRIIKLDDSCLRKADILGRNILFVEWARQTGSTFKAASEKILKLAPAALQSYAVFRVGEGEIAPDYYGVACDVLPHNPWSIY